MEYFNAPGIPVRENAGAMVSKEIGFAADRRSHVWEKQTAA
jgi:hypothetical protein